MTHGRPPFLWRVLDASIGLTWRGVVFALVAAAKFRLEDGKAYYG